MSEVRVSLGQWLGEDQNTSKLSVTIADGPGDGGQHGRARDHPAAETSKSCIPEQPSRFAECNFVGPLLRDPAELLDFHSNSRTSGACRPAAGWVGTRPAGEP